MKRLIYLCLILLVVHMPFVANAQDNDKPDLPAEAELSAIVDSILDEGFAHSVLYSWLFLTMLHRLLLHFFLFLFLAY